MSTTTAETPAAELPVMPDANEPAALEEAVLGATIGQRFPRRKRSASS